jgi:hypothetical protein
MVAGTAGKSLALARYLPDGSLDPSFSSDGKLLVSVVEDATLVTASGVALAAHGGIVVGGLACSLAIAMCSWPGSRPAAHPTRRLARVASCSSKRT